MMDDDATSPEAGTVLAKAAYYARYYREVQKPRRAAGLVAHREGPESGPRLSRTVYQPLLDSLAARSEPAVTLTFAEIEAILDAALPAPASIRKAFGTDDHIVSARQLHALGWRARLDMRGRVAHFARGTRPDRPVPRPPRARRYAASATVALRRGLFRVVLHSRQRP